MAKKNSLIDSLQTLPVNTEEPRGPGGSVPTGFQTDTECDKLTGQYKDLCEQRSLVVKSTIPDDEQLPLDTPPLQAMQGETTSPQKLETQMAQKGFVGTIVPAEAISRLSEKQVQEVYSYAATRAQQYREELGISDDEFQLTCRENKKVSNKHLMLGISKYFKDSAHIYDTVFPKYLARPKSGWSASKQTTLARLTRDELCVLIAYLNKIPLKMLAVGKPSQLKSIKATIWK